MKRALWFSFLVLLSLMNVGNSAKILGLFVTYSKSHLIIHKSVMEPLIERGHDVTIVTTLPLEDSGKRYRHIQLDVPPAPKEFMSGIVETSQSLFGLLLNTKKVTDFSLEYSNLALHDPKMKRLMEEESFDLVVFGVFFNMFQIGVAAHFKCPIVMSFMQRPMRLVNTIVGNPLEVTYVPEVFVGNVQPLGFFDRVKNFLMVLAMDISFLPYVDYKTEHLYNYNFPSEKYPTYSEMLKNISLVLTCSHLSEGVIRPNVPAIVEVGGIQVKSKPDPLPKDLEKFLDGASKEGAVYFSLGSNARSADMNSETIKILYNVLSKLKQRVIWKWEENERPWLPQDDILAHPNIKLFITHGGHGSVVESKYHGVPMVGIPLFADQFANIDAVQKAGHGLSLGKEKITAERFKSIVEEVLSNPTYRNKVQEFSRIYKDRPMSPRDTAAYWIEYVIRHRGAKHIQSPAVYMNLIQLYGLDVLAFLLAILYVVIKILAFVFREVFRLFFGRNSKNQNKDGSEQKKNQ
ncbi:UDP-glycosyltransferase UGT5-like isoform X3 [Hermetia illucens]|uniref:UDP-glycosyltransferase UGT5-like isoform X3 n=1 Tax=Hermetia illucens TaxID=343691 RepID=UPI0018CC204A|nr:UDP-glycosyltransferase UGT5-like isoform X3 [Hermetia illucens]